MRASTLLGFLGTAALAGLVIDQRRRDLQLVDPALRVPSLWLPEEVTNPLALAVLRHRRARQDARTPVAPHTALVATAAGAPDVDLLRFDPPETTSPETTTPETTTPETTTTGAVLWIHGGGLIVGSPERTSGFGQALAAELGVPVFLNRYRLAPEHPYPAAIDDCFTALQWLHSQADELQIDPNKIIIGGHSAGGGLAAALAQRALDADLAVAQQILVYPMLDERTGMPGRPSSGGQFAWTPRSNQFAWASYLGHQPTVAERPYASARRRDDLVGLAPAWIGVGDIDLFAEEDRAYAHRLIEADVPTELLIIPGMYHAAEREVPHASSMISFHQSMLAAMRDGLGRTA